MEVMIFIVLLNLWSSKCHDSKDLKYQPSSVVREVQYCYCPFNIEKRCDTWSKICAVGKLFVQTFFNSTHIFPEFHMKHTDFIHYFIYEKP